MQPIQCELCTHKISPHAKACPRCGHPRSERKKAKWYELSFEVPKMFYAMLFVGFCFGSAVLLLLGMFAMREAETIWHEVLGMQMVTAATVLALTSLVSLIASDKS
jgi:hypothetical protein